MTAFIADIDVCRTVADDVLDQIVAIDMAALSYRSFLRSFGDAFMHQIYSDILSKQLGLLIVAKRNDRIIGFVIGCYDSDKVMHLILDRFWTYLRIMLPKVLAKPTVIGRLIQTFFYTKKEKVQVDSELLSIAIDDENRNAGIGGRLVRRLNEEFMKRGVRHYKVTVHAEMESSNRFYVRQGMRLSNSFAMYGVLWNLYICELNP